MAGALCKTITAGFFDCEGQAPIPLPGIDGQLRPRLLLVGQTPVTPDLGLLGRFEGRMADLEEVKLPWLWNDDWRSSALVFLAKDEPAIVTGRGNIGLARMGAHTPEPLVANDAQRRIVFDDVLPAPGGGFWFLFGQGGTPPDYTADYIKSRRSLSLGRYVAGRLQPPVELLPVTGMTGARLGPTPGDPLVVAIALTDTDGAVPRQPILLAPGGQPIQLTGPSGVYVDSVVGLADGALVAMKSVVDSRLTAHLTGTDGALGPGLELFGPSDRRSEGCVRGTDPSYYAGDDSLHCGGSVVTRCHVVGRRVETLPVMAYAGRALFAAVIVDVDQDTVSGTRTSYEGDMPPRCREFQAVSADRSVTRVVIEEVGVGPMGLEIARSAELLLSDWQRPSLFFGRSAGPRAIITLNDVDHPRALALVLGD